MLCDIEKPFGNRQAESDAWVVRASAFFVGNPQALRLTDMSSLCVRIAGVVLSAFLISTIGRAQTLEFVRGDANDDGVVSLADAHHLQNLLFRGMGELVCGDAADVDNDGSADISDSLQIVRHMIAGAMPPASPFPARGPDDGFDPIIDEPWPCAATGSAAPLSDVSAQMQILDAIAPGGTDRHVSVELLVAHATPLAGYHAELDTAGIISPRDLDHNDLDDGVLDLSGTYAGGMLGVHADPQQAALRVTFLTSLLADVVLSPSGLTPVLRAELCLEPGTPAGIYPIIFRTGELVDFASGRRIDPALVSGTISVLRDVEVADCAIPPSSPTATSALNIAFTLGNPPAAPGGEVSVPFLIETDDQVDTRGLRFSVDFDEERVDFVAVETVIRRPDGTDWPWQRYTADRTDGAPGNGGVDEGYVAGFYLYADLPQQDQGFAFPKGEEFHALNLVFRVRPSAPDGRTAIRFVDGGELCILLSPPQSRFSCQPLKNEIISGAFSIPAALAGSFQLVDGSIEVTRELPSFVRGDANDDSRIDLSDAVRSLEYLFVGLEPLLCADAADANDDGKVDISDPVAELGYLFLGSPSLPDPFGACGVDPSRDNVGCEAFAGCP